VLGLWLELIDIAGSVIPQALCDSDTISYAAYKVAKAVFDLEKHMSVHSIAWTPT
jgi:hypothetical protein